MARPAGFEPATSGLGFRYSIRLSYGRSLNAIKIIAQEPPKVKLEIFRRPWYAILNSTLYTRYREARAVEYLVTWIEGEEVDYRILKEEELEIYLEEEKEKNCITVPLA